MRSTDTKSRLKKEARVASNASVKRVMVGGLMTIAVLGGLSLNHVSKISVNSNERNHELPASDSPFAATVPNRAEPPEPAPEGMVWIPGGEFSMGSTIETESLCGLPGVTRDALP